MKSFLQYLTESKLLEGKQEFLKKYSSEPDVKDLVNKFWVIRQRLKAPQNDIDYWIKQPYDEFKKFVVNFDTSKNKETRKQDSYTKEAENWGAVMFGNFGPYEAWFVPTYEAAVQLGRFYKGISTNWCISTNNSEYFNSKYKKYEFIFLILTGDKSLENYQKVALQILNNKITGVWTTDDTNIVDNIPEFLDQIINDVMPVFYKLNRSRNDNIIKTKINKNIENILNQTKIIDDNTISKKLHNIITDINIPNNVIEIKDFAFYGYEQLESVNISESVTKIGKDAFGFCKALEKINIPDSVTEINNNAFEYCKSLKEINIPNSITEINSYIFNSCIALESVTIPNSVKKINTCAFSFCKSLKEINIPDSVTEISNAAFEYCYQLKSVNIPSSVTKINDSTFQFCESLESITIPDSVTELGYNVFYNCKSLNKVIFSSNSPLIDDITDEIMLINYGLTEDQIFIKK